MPTSHPSSSTQRVTIQQAIRTMDGKRKIMIDVPQPANTNADESSPASDPDVDRHLERLRDRMRDTNVTRADFLAEVRQKVRNGDYLTREAAETSAAQILKQDGEELLG